ncbi:MAG: hypothetical protein JO093_09385 [Acidobacteria bacterium]|nr:hypothetical protein [Acidobacteriota bacterium]MBV9070160.1 hypothetical protein [Acidobacteriota bacterium]MBV9185826.1 hypothetical protein [Acidobacteriota bacterium]
MRARVETGRHIQRERFRRSGAQCNAEMSPHQLRRWCDLGSPSRADRTSHRRLGLSAPAYDRLLKVARASLRERDRIPLLHTCAVRTVDVEFRDHPRQSALPGHESRRCIP